MRLYQFLKLFHGRGDSNRSLKQKTIFARAVSEVERYIYYAIEQKKLRYIQEYVANPPRELPGRFLENGLQILQTQPLSNLRVIKNKIYIQNLLEVKFSSILNVSRNELILLCYGQADVNYDLPVLCGLIEFFPSAVALPYIQEYTYWVLTEQHQPVTTYRDAIIPKTKDEIIDRVTQIITPSPNIFEVLGKG